MARAQGDWLMEGLSLAVDTVRFIFVLLLVRLPLSLSPEKAGNGGLVFIIKLPLAGSYKAGQFAVQSHYYIGPQARES